MQKTKCEKCGNDETEILRRGKFGRDVLFCPCCDDICNTKMINFYIDYVNLDSYRK